MTPMFTRAAAGALLVAAGAALFAQSTAPATIPSTTVPSATLPDAPALNATVTEWVIFVADVSQGQLNRKDAFEDSLPRFVNDLRTEPVEESQHLRSQPHPVGVIRLSSDAPRAAGKATAFDVQLTFQNGRALGHWPNAKNRTRSFLWQDVQIASQDTELRVLPQGEWLTELRSGGPLLTCGTTTEPFLLYDVELAYPVTLNVSGGDGGGEGAAGGGYKVYHTMDAPMLDLSFYKKDPAGSWRSASLPTLARTVVASSTTQASIQATPPSPTDAPAATTAPAGWRPASLTTSPETIPTPATRAATQATQPTSAARMATSVPSTQSAATNPAATQPAGTPVVLASTADSEISLLAPWKPRLALAGVSAADQDVILKILAKNALDPKRLTAIYRMDPAELDRILTLEVVPQPRKVARIALVVIRGIDPMIRTELDRWVAQLGDRAWEKREAAMAEIRKIGIPAKPALEQATKDKDLEVVFRAEQLLTEIASPAPAPPENR